MSDVIHRPGPRRCDIRQVGDRVLLIVEGRAILDMPWRAADKVADALRQAARNAEEQAKAEHIAADAALLLRTGAPFGFSSDPKIRDEAGKLAAHDRTLRRALPGGIKSKEMFGRPAIIGHDTPRPRRNP